MNGFSSKIEEAALDAKTHGDDEKVAFDSIPPSKPKLETPLSSKKVPAASPKSVVEVDGFEGTVERTPLYYEKIEDIFDELPEFAQEIIASQYLLSSRTK